MGRGEDKGDKGSLLRRGRNPVGFNKVMRLSLRARMMSTVTNLTILSALGNPALDGPFANEIKGWSGIERGDELQASRGARGDRLGPPGFEGGGEAPYHKGGPG